MKTDKSELKTIVNLINRSIDDDDISLFIAMLDDSYKSWDVTEKLIGHYKHMDKIHRDTCGEEWVVEPKNLLEDN